MPAGVVVPYTGQSYKSFRKTYKRRKAMTKNQRGVVAKIAKRVVTSMAETHYIDTSSTGVDATYTWQLTALVNPAVGDTDITRNGDEILQHRLSINFNIIGSDATNLCRVAIIRWLGDQAPSATDIFSTDSNVLAPLSEYTNDTRAMFHVIYDSGALSLVLNGSSAQLSRQKKISLKGYKQRFAGASTTSDKGQLYLLYASDSSVGGHPSLKYYFRHFFKDI